MSTKTGHTFYIVDLLGRLASLLADAIDIIRKGQRQASMTNALLIALQLYKENRLAVVKAMPESDSPSKHKIVKRKRKGKIDPNLAFLLKKIEWARVQIDERHKEEGHVCELACLMAAEIYMDQGFPGHQCYWNDRFGVALAVGFDGDILRQAAWCSVSNGLNDYWEWRTHYGYDLAKALKDRGVSLPGDEQSGYKSLPFNIAGQLVDLFDLPTTVVGSKEKLTKKEAVERDRFNRKYPYSPVL